MLRDYTLFDDTAREEAWPKRKRKATTDTLSPSSTQCTHAPTPVTHSCVVKREPVTIRRRPIKCTYLLLRRSNKVSLPQNGHCRRHVR